MNLGITEEMLKERSLSLGNSDSFLFKISEDYGRYSSDLYIALAKEASAMNGVQASYTYQLLALGDSFNLIASREYVDDSCADSSLSIPYRDLHSEPFYEQIAKTREQEQTAVVILFLAALSQINTARILIPKVSEGNGLSALKIRF